MDGWVIEWGGSWETMDSDGDATVQEIIDARLPIAGWTIQELIALARRYTTYTPLPGVPDP